MTSRFLLPILFVLSFSVLLLSCFLGSTQMGMGRTMSALVGLGSDVDQIIIWEIRLPRALTAYAVGICLGVSGASLQGLLRNPLAEPGILGVSATSALFATSTIYFGLASLSPFLLSASAMLGALMATALLAFAAIRIRSVVTLILLGVGLSSFAGAMMSLLVNMAPTPFALSDMFNWMMGSVANRSLNDLGMVLPIMFAGIGILVFTSRGLTILTLGEEAAQGAGLDLSRQRLWTVIGAGLATGAAVAVAGVIGFVGIVAPHLVRPWVQYDSGRTVLPAGLLAGALLVLADIGVRLLPTRNELNLGVLAALIGAPFFIWIAAQRRGQASHA